MEKKLKLGAAGLVHDHVWHELDCWRRLPQVEFVAVADPHAELCERAVSEFGASRRYESAEAMLAAESLDVSLRTVQRERRYDQDFDHEVRLALQQSPDPLKLMEHGYTSMQIHLHTLYKLPLLTEIE